VDVIIPIKGGTAIIDDEDYEKVKPICWHLAKSRDKVYVRGNFNGRKVMMHRFLMGVLDDPQTLIDHRNGVTVDNRRSVNLRSSSHVQNGQNKQLSSRNSTGYKGVTFHKTSQRYRASIMFGGKVKHLGSFRCPTKAWLAYVKAAKEFHGDFACTGYSK
jgi:hypothetical protein